MIRVPKYIINILTLILLIQTVLPLNVKALTANEANLIVDLLQELHDVAKQIEAEVKQCPDTPPGWQSTLPHIVTAPKFLPGDQEVTDPDVLELLLTNIERELDHSNKVMEASDSFCP